MLAALAGPVRAYQTALIILAAGSLLMIQRSPRLLLLLAGPVAVLAVHWSRLNARYLYPTMPLVVMAAALALYGMYRVATTAGVRRNQHTVVRRG